MYNFFICNILSIAEEEMLKYKHSYVGTEHLILALLKESDAIKNICKPFNLTYDNFKSKVLELMPIGNNEDRIILYTPLLKRIIYNAEEDSKNNQEELNELYLFKSFLEIGEGIAIKILIKLDIDLDNLYKSINLEKINSNLEITKIGTCLNESNLNNLVINRDKEINLIIETLLRMNKNNPLLIGDAGVGKTAIVEELARRISKGNVPEELKNKKIINLELGSLISGTKYRGEFEEKLTNIIKEIEMNKDIILFIDEIHGISNAGGADGAINASDILKPYLARGVIKLIGATTLREYNKHIAKDKALARRFELIKISEPSEEETIDILNKIKYKYEKHYNIKITKENIVDIVKLTNKYILNRCNPDKSLDILDSVCSMMKLNQENNYDYLDKLENDKLNYIKNNDYKNATKIKEEILRIKNISNKVCSLTKKDILKCIYEKCNLKFYLNKDKIISNIKNKTLDKYQDSFDKVIGWLEKDIENFDRPLTLLFKYSNKDNVIEFIKNISNMIDMNLITLDMNDYSDEMSITKLVGTSPGYVGYEEESVLNEVIMYPNSIILLKDFDKANSKIIDLFKRIINEGILLTSKQDKINFKNAIIILTTKEVNKNRIGFENTVSKEQNKYDFVHDTIILHNEKIVTS